MTAPPALSWALLDQLPPPDRAAVLACVVRRSWGSGQQVFGQGDPADALHLIETGRVTVSSRTPDGDAATFAVLGQGECFGELALVLPGRRRTAEVVAVEPTTTLALDAQRFGALRTRHPVVDRVLVDVLAAQVDRLSDHLVEALHVPVEQRVLRRLVHLSRSDPVITLTQEQMAGLAGTSRPTVNRVLRQAEREGLVRLGRGTVRVLDRWALVARTG